MVLYLDRMCQRGLHAVLWSHIGTLMHRLAAEPYSTAGLLFPSRCPSGTILVTPYSMVWDWRVSRAGPMLLYWPKLLYPYYSLQLFFPFSSFCLRLILWGCGLRTDRVYTTLSQPCMPTFVNNNNNNNNNNNKVPPERLMHSINRYSSSTAGIRSCNLTTFSIRGNHLAYGATRGIP